MTHLAEYLQEKTPTAGQKPIRKATKTLISRLAQGTSQSEIIAITDAQGHQHQILLDRETYETVFTWAIAIQDLMIYEAAKQSHWVQSQLETVIVTGAAAPHPFVVDLIQEAAPLATVIPKGPYFTLEDIEAIIKKEIEETKPALTPVKTY